MRWSGVLLITIKLTFIFSFFRLDPSNHLEFAQKSQHVFMSYCETPPIWSLRITASDTLGYPWAWHLPRQCTEEMLRIQQDESRRLQQRQMSVSANIILIFKIYKGEIDLSLPDFFLRPPKPGHTCHVDEESALFLYIWWNTGTAAGFCYQLILINCLASKYSA